VDTAHLLLALCDDEESLALRIVESVGSRADELRAAVEAQLA
jgi:Clp amino terminal domain, pathogenicity island component